MRSVGSTPTSPTKIKRGFFLIVSNKVVDTTGGNNMRDNAKKRGEKGVQITIGEFAKWDVQVAFPLSDNLPFDLILIYNNKLYKAQVKSGKRRKESRGRSYSEGTSYFKLSSNNWYSKTVTRYYAKDIDVMVLCDYERVFLLSPKEFDGRTVFVIREQPSKNNQKIGCNMAEDYLLCKERLEKVLC